MDNVESAIISVRPPFADSIVSGSKTVEFRRRIPLVAKGTCLWIYSTKPVGAIVGRAFVKEIERGTPREIWRSCQAHGGISKVEFDRYFNDTHEAIGIHLHKVQRQNSIDIEMLRTLRAGFHPPQVILRITAAEAAALYRMSKDPIAA